MDGPSSPLLLFVPSLAVFKNDPSKGDQGWKLVFLPVPEEDTLAWLILYHGSYKGFSHHQHLQISISGAHFSLRVGSVDGVPRSYEGSLAKIEEV